MFIPFLDCRNFILHHSLYQVASFFSLYIHPKGMAIRKKDAENSDHGANSKMPSIVAEAEEGDIINVSGHKQELHRVFSKSSAVALAITSGNVWPALAGSIVYLSNIPTMQ